MRSDHRTRWCRLAVSAVLAALVPAGVAMAAPKVVSVSTRSSFNTGESQVLIAAVDRFNHAQREYKVELFASNYRNHADWVQSVATSGSMPCVLEVDGPFVARFAWPGYLMPLDRFITPELRRDLLPSVLTQGSFDGQVFSLGQFDSGLGLWANRRHLRAAGVRIPTVGHPWTLDEFEQALAKLARVPGVDYALNLALYSGTSEFFPYAYLPILVGFGGDFIDRPGLRHASGVLDGPQSVVAMQHFQDWFRRGWTRAVFDRNDDFERGRNALLWTGHWKYRDLQRALGDDLVLLPLPDFGHGVKTGMGSWGWAITSTCSEPKGAWAFLSHLMSDAEILRMTEVNGAVPARRSALAHSSLYGPGKPLEVYAQQLFSGDGVPRPATPAYGTIGKAFSMAVQEIIGGADVQQALTRAARTIDDDIAANRGYGR